MPRSDSLGLAPLPKMLNLHSTLLIPPAYESGSLGDEAALLGAIQHLRQHGASTIGLLSFEGADNWGYPALRVAVDEVVVLPDYQADVTPFMEVVRRYGHVLALGADMMDGYYADSDTLRITQLLTLAAHAGAETSLVSFSFNDRPTPATIAALNDLPDTVHFTVRDPVSRDRLSRYVARPLTLTADLAFLLKPDDDSPMVQSVRDWIQRQHEAGHGVMGVNINNLHLRALPSRDAGELVGIYRDALVEVTQDYPDLSLLLIPHDQRGEVSDVSLAAGLFEALPADIQERSLQVPFPCRAAEIKAICRDLDGALTGRMHLAIACLGQGIPVVDIVYQGKCEGLFQHFYLNPAEVAMEPQQAFEGRAIAFLLRHLLVHQDSLRRDIQMTLPQVQHLATRNFVTLSKLGRC